MALHPFTFDRVRGHDAVRAMLADAVRAERVPQALLFHGPPGVGKSTLALALAAAVNCDAAVDARPCGSCLPCRKIARFNHPDVHFVMPVFPAALWKEETKKSEKDEPESPLCKVYAEWADDPFHVFEWTKRPSVSTEWILEVRSEANLMTFEGRTKVVVISSVETLGVEASNRMLKMLEEPGPNTLFVLTADRLHRVLPTIRSRCQRVAFGALDRSTIAHMLVEWGADAGAAEHLAALSRGSFSRAARLAADGALETREWTLRLMTHHGRDVSAHLAEAVLADSRLWDVPRVRLVAEVLITWYRDALVARYGAADADLVNRDRVADVRQAAERLTAGEIGRRIRRLERLDRDVEHQVTPSLALFTTLGELLGSSTTHEVGT